MDSTELSHNFRLRSGEADVEVEGFREILPVARQRVESERLNRWGTISRSLCRRRQSVNSSEHGGHVSPASMDLQGCFTPMPLPLLFSS
jgi:hypothetical protein